MCLRSKLFLGAKNTHVQARKVGQHNIIYHYKILRCSFVNSRHHEYGVNITVHGWYNVRHFSHIVVKNITWQTVTGDGLPCLLIVLEFRIIGKNEAKKPYANGARVAAAVSII